MSLRHALLALLSAGPATGYDAAKRFSGSVGHVWSAPDSQIYPELKRMQVDGLVESSAVRWGPRSTKTQYTITDAGLEELIDWAGRALPYSPPRDTHHLQAAYLEWTDIAGARRFFEDHIDHHTEQRQLLLAVHAGIVARTDPMITRRLSRFPDSDHERIVAFKAHTYAGMVARSEAEIAWAREGLAMLDTLAADGGVGGGAAGENSSIP
ncbi:PadR family transcriptional regulator [Gordonia sp. L191]|uniref:PadR family transcriptional regulator n=1 Tax=Gordonia sp. L191 TaxID=2982699 RepID=UPI0024C0AD94|nr:PadR family transcriptional regulator [Gordonia sp. L191]WHU48023.1 PadR family transcriptional regulator [Gordonia sp. L191]